MVGILSKISCLDEGWVRFKTLYTSVKSAPCRSFSSKLSMVSVVTVHQCIAL